jgi:hypothetical protein
MFIGYSAVIIASSLLFNGILYFSLLYLNKYKFKPTHLIILNVATVDICIISIYLPLLLLSMFQHACNPSYCALLMSVEKALFAGEMWSVVLVSGDRYLFIVKHTNYKQKMSRRRSITCIILVWLIIGSFSAISSVMAMCTTQNPTDCEECHFTQLNFGFYNLLFTALYITMCLILPITCLMVFYGFVMREAHNHSTHVNKNPFCHKRYYKNRVQNKELDTPVESRATHTLLRNRACQLKAVRILLLLLCVHILCSLPYFINNLISASSHQPAASHDSYVNAITAMLMATNCAFNPLFYGLANRKLRVSFIKWICGHNLCTQHELNQQEGITMKRCASFNQLSVMGDSSSVSSSHVGSVPSSPFGSQASMYSSTSRDALMSRDVLSVVGHPLVRNTASCVHQSHTHNLL